MCFGQAVLKTEDATLGQKRVNPSDAAALSQALEAVDLRARWPSPSAPDLSTRAAPCSRYPPPAHLPFLLCGLQRAEALEETQGTGRESREQGGTPGRAGGRISATSNKNGQGRDSHHIQDSQLEESHAGKEEVPHSREKALFPLKGSLTHCWPPCPCSAERTHPPVPSGAPSMARALAQLKGRRGHQCFRFTSAQLKTGPHRAGGLEYHSAIESEAEPTPATLQVNLGNTTLSGSSQGQTATHYMTPFLHHAHSRDSHRDRAARWLGDWGSSR